MNTSSPIIVIPMCGVGSRFKSNGYIKHNGLYEETTVQCATCKSEGELKYGQAEVDNFIYNTYFRKRV